MQPDIESIPAVQQLTAQSQLLLEVGQNYVVSTAAEYQVAGLELQRVKATQKQLEDVRRGMTRPLDIAKKAIMDFFRGPEDKLARAESGIKRSMLAYSQEQERLRQEEQRKAAEKARKEQERLQAQAAKAAEQGQHTKAEQLQDRAVSVVAPVIQREAPKIPGISDRDNWRAECVDLRALVKAVHEGRAPLSYLMASDKVLGQQARSLKQDFVCDGVRVWSEKNIAAGSAA